LLKESATEADCQSFATVYTQPHHTTYTFLPLHQLMNPLLSDIFTKHCTGCNWRTSSNQNV